MSVLLGRAAALALCLVACPAPAAAEDLELDAESGFAVAATINGHPVRLRVEPEASGYIILNPATVGRIGLRRSLIGSRTQIGPVRLDGNSKVARLAIGAWRGNRRMVWIDRAATLHADGLIGPADMPYDRILFRLGPAREGEREYSVPLEFERSFGLFFRLALGDASVLFKFSLSQPFTLATAAAGARLAEHHGGQWQGPVRDQVINYNVARPVRPFALERPVTLEGFALASLMVRTGDHRGGLALPPEPDADPDEIVIDGASRQRARYYVTVGLDRLADCSTMIWDNRTRRMTLRCVAPEEGGGSVTEE